MATKPVNVESPVGEFEWVFITGEGKENLSGTAQYVVNVVCTPEAAKPLQDEIKAFFDANRPKGVKEPKSLGFYPHTIPTDQKDEDGKVIYEEDGKVTFSFKTNVTFRDGSRKIVKTFNAKGAEVSLGTKKIGNGSRGRVQGAYGLYEVKDKKGTSTISAGVSLFLNGVQISKFVEFTGGLNFAAMDEDEGDFEGVGDMGGIPDETPTSSDATADSSAKPRL